MMSCYILLLTLCTDVATEVLNRCIVRDQEKRDGSIHITYNYEFLDEIYKNDNSDDRYNSNGRILTQPF